VDSTKPIQDGIEKISEELGEKLGMKPGDWLLNLRLWELYKGKRKDFDQCNDHREALQRGLIPEDLITSDLVDLDF